MVSVTLGESVEILLELEVVVNFLEGFALYPEVSSTDFSLASYIFNTS